jgi:hypothetical protein
MGKPVRRCFQYKDLREQTYVFAKISVRAGQLGTLFGEPLRRPPVAAIFCDDEGSYRPRNLVLNAGERRAPLSFPSPANAGGG